VSLPSCSGHSHLPLCWLSLLHLGPPRTPGAPRKRFLPSEASAVYSRSRARPPLRSTVVPSRQSDGPPLRCSSPSTVLSSLATSPGAQVPPKAPLKLSFSVASTPKTSPSGCRSSRSFVRAPSLARSRRPLALISAKNATVPSATAQPRGAAGASTCAASRRAARLAAAQQGAAAGKRSAGRLGATPPRARFARRAARGGWRRGRVGYRFRSAALAAERRSVGRHGSQGTVRT
jgi:hypothetical protein